MISVTVDFGNITAASSQSYVKSIVFTAIAGTNNYTDSTAAALSRMVGFTMVKVEVDGSNLINGGSILATWDNTNFTISGMVTILGGERVLIFYV